MKIPQNSISKAVVLGALLMGLLPSAQAFDTGPHQDLTREVMGEFGMNDEANRTVQLENWLVDYYSNSPTTRLFIAHSDGSVNGAVDAVLAKHRLELLHFDNLTDTQKVTHYWGRLTANTKSAVQDAAREKNPMKLLSLMGASLHAVQDFYTHSTWVETHPAAGADYNTVTWFDTTQDGGVRTGKYPNSDPINGSVDHGNYDKGLNHDSQSRPEFGRAYVFAYSASRQWVNQIRSWVDEVDPQVWQAAQNISLSDKDKNALNNGLEAAYRISEWVIPGGSDGHWKGKGSGNLAAWALASAKWVAADGGSFVDHFRQDRYFELLSGGRGQAQDLGTDAPSTIPIPKVAHIAIRKAVVLVRTVQIKELPVGFFESKIDPLGTPDFYAKISIDGTTLLENTFQNRGDVGHPWETIKFVDDNRRDVNIRIEVWDEDQPYDGDDHCDIRNGGGYDQEMQFNMQTHNLSGSINGIFDNDNKLFGESGDEKDRAFIRGFVTTRSLMDPTPIYKDTPQSGPNFVVNTNEDHDNGMCGVTDCTLREAISAANANADDSTISFDPSVFAQRKVIALAGNLPDITTNMHILGPTAPGAGVTLQQNHYNGITFRVTANTALIDHFNFHNGLSGVSAIGGKTTVLNSTFVSCIYGVYAEGQAIVEDCTFFRTWYGVTTSSAAAVLKANSCTITGTITGLRVDSGTLHLLNCISVDNNVNVQGNIINEGNNILTGTVKEVGLQNDGSRAVMSYNGGPTETIALLAGGTAVDGGATTLHRDQRGLPRVQGKAPDVGAFELQTSTPAGEAKPSASAPSAFGS